MEPVYNPYLPLTEYIPDGEPHVFGDRLYIYGSHDAIRGKAYCERHYNVWSAPAGNLKDWRNEDVSYLRDGDPTNKEDQLQLWAPDAARGPDGRYYLYYCYSFYPEIGVAVSESPAGPFRFYGHVHYPENILGGKTVQEEMVFDPAVLVDDDGRVWLYYGFCPACEKEMKLPEITPEMLEKAPKQSRRMLELLRNVRFGENSMVMELEPDMVTAKELPRVLIPGGHHTAGTGFEGHGFFEASSIRKIRGRYYFVYSSHKSHELCYAVSDRPDSGFVYGGTIVSNGDIGLNGRETPVYPLSNNHGGIACIGDQCYIFYHRATDGNEFSRQGCAEPITIGPDGHIAQAEMTSCGLNGGPLPASGSYPAGICCHLTDPTVINKIDYSDPVMKTQVRVTEQQNTSFITAIKDRTTVGYKYFSFESGCTLALELRGTFAGKLTVSQSCEGSTEIGRTEIDPDTDQWRILTVRIHPETGKGALYLHFRGTGSMDLKSLAFLSE